MRSEVPESMVQSLAQLLRDHGNTVLDGSRVLSLITPCLQVVTRLFEQLLPRGPGTGFQAVPAYPADNVAVLRAQFLLDMLQKAPSLKLIHPEDAPRRFEVNIFPFNALRSLELRCLPPKCLRGLRNVYSQLEVLICSECVTTLEEVISVCGGDKGSALPWLELHTLDFSHNKIHTLDKSLELLNVLRILDLSHNLLEDCGSFLKVLSELQYLNLGYNSLKSVPELSPESCAQLRTLVLRHNQLSSTSGLEHLYNLQHLDLSYNLLVEHSQLARLARLQNLRKLYLEGNPVYFHKEYPAIAAQHLSPKALDKVLLDGKPLPGQKIMGGRQSAQIAPVLRERAVFPLPYNSTTESSCTGDLTDSCSAPEKIVVKPITRKKSKVKVRRASISERSDSECDQRGQPVVSVLQHQKDIERTDSFREQFGVDWLQYRSHLEDELNRDSPGSAPLCTKPLSSPLNLQALIGAISQPRDPGISNPGSAKPPNPGENSMAAANVLIEQIEDVLEDGLWQRPETSRQEEEEEEVDAKKDAVCSPVTVCPVVDGKPLNPDWPWIFLRVTRRYVLEIELKRGRVQMKRELQTLRNIQIAMANWSWKGKEEELPLLTLSFQSICEDKQSVSYIVLDNTKDVSIKTLLDVLYPVLEANLRALSSVEEQGPTMLQCLKCKTEFSQEENGGNNQTAAAERPAGAEKPDDNHKDHTACPSCGSFHVILAPLQPNAEANTPGPAKQAPEGTEGPGERSFYLGEGEGTETEGAQPDAPDGEHSGLLSSYTYGTPTPPPAQDSPTSEGSPQLDFRLVDHRLKLFLDMEILGGEMEEFQCSMKVPVVRFGKPEDYWALVVVSNQNIYFLEITGETRGPPGDWLKLGETHSLTSLTHLHIGLQKQCLHLGFESPEAAYTLLTRNCSFSTSFTQHIIDTLADLPQHYQRSLQYNPEEEVTEDHRLLPFLHNSLGAGSHPEYFYVLAHFIREDPSSIAPSNPCVNAEQPPSRASPAARAQGARGTIPVSLLLTKTDMYLLAETHQWLHVTPPSGEDDDKEPPKKVTLIEKQAIINISSLHLFRCAPLHLRIRLYHETQRKESAWQLWTEDPTLPTDIAEWLRVPWESMYRIKIKQVTHDTMTSYKPCE